MKKLIMLVICLMPMMVQAQTELGAEMVGNNDLNQIFLNQNSSTDVLMLSDREMTSTEASSFPFLVLTTAIGGATGAFISYSKYGSVQWSAVANGMVSGLYAGLPINIGVKIFLVANAQEAMKIFDNFETEIAKCPPNRVMCR